MNNRITAVERPVSGLIAWLESTRVVLPLKGVECEFTACGEVVSVEIDQIFEQSQSQSLDCLYSFPLPAGAAVYRCEMHVNGRVIRAQVEEREAAKKIARQKKAYGFRTALVEMERDNLFTLSLGNVQPGDLVVIRFAYFQPLTHLGDWTSFRIPFCPGIRYIPGTPLLRAPSGRGSVDDTDQVPDASRISPPRIDRLHADAAYLAVAGTIEHGPGTSGLSSPTHPVLVRPGAGRSQVALANERAVPDSDFIIRWTEHPAAVIKGSGWFTRSNEQTFALARFRAPNQVAPSETYAQDVYFLIDRSSSMAGLKWEKANEAFRAFLGLMGRGDRIWATFFNDSFQDYSEKPEPAERIASDAGLVDIAAQGVAGGTELLPALNHVIEKINIHSAARPACLILLTDGEVGNEAAILQSLARRSSLRVHVFGIDVTMNDGFLQKLAAQHSGSVCLLSPRDDIVGAVKRSAARLRQPVLTSLLVNEEWEMPTPGLPDLYAGDVMTLSLRRQASAPLPEGSPSLVRLKGRASDGSVQVYELNLEQTSAPALPLLWVKRRIDSLCARGESAEAIGLAKAHNLVCEGTAFIAWDEAEQVAISTHELYQPSIDPTDFSVLSAGFCGKPQMAPRAARRFSLSEPGVEYPDRTDQRDGILELLKADTLLRGPAGVEFLLVLFKWSQAEPHQTGSRVRLLKRLATKMIKASNEPESKRVALLRKWVARVLQEPFLAEAKKQLELMEAGLAVQKSGS